MFKVDLIVRPRVGVRDPQGEAVQEALRGIGVEQAHIHCVGRYLSLEIDAPDEAAARQTLDEMCRSLLVNPNLETYEAVLTEQGTEP